jgi:multidrug resistance efflux pump
MKEFFVVLVVIIVLLGLTAIKYRRQLPSLVGFARLLKEAGSSVSDARKASGQTVKTKALVSCSVCSVWIPEDKAVRKGDQIYCSTDCIKA